MKTLLAAFVLLSAALSFGQSPQIASFTVTDHQTTCTYVVGVTTTPCSIGSGMFLTISGSNFGTLPEGVSLCDCPFTTLRRWSDTEISSIVNSVAPLQSVSVELPTGAWSNAVPYTALAPIITRIEVGTCIYQEGQSKRQCVVVPGAQITIRGKYFGPGIGQVGTCDCAGATIDSWNPDWSFNPSPTDNTVVATAVTAICGSFITLQANTMWSNPVPYTTCGSN